MTYKNLITVLAAVICSFAAAGAKATDYSRLPENPSKEDSLRFKINAPILTPEELALLAEYIPNEPNDVIADRLSCIESTIPLAFNSYVRNFIDYFTIRNRKYTRNMLTRENVYFPMFEEYLTKHNMPQDLKYLAIVESGLNPKAVSHAGAAGLWQFMPGTGRDFKLSQDQHFDERLDPEKSTEAAMKFLRRLHRMYDDWELALAAYNCGPGNVNKAIRKAGGGKKTFWEIFPYLPKETRGYIPSMTAVIYAMKYAPEHNIFSDSILYAIETDTMMISQAVDLGKLARELHMEPKALLALNPEIKKPTLPGHVRKYPLRIPAQRALLASKDRSCMLLAAAPGTQPRFDKTKEQTPVLLAAAKANKATLPSPPAVSERDEKTYLVQRGDNLLQIANRHRVTVPELKEWNNLTSDHINLNQKLIVYEQKEGTATILLASTKSDSKPTPETPKTEDDALKADQLIHQVQPGDTLWTISQRYKGMTVEELKKRNKLKSNEIKPGQKLIVS